MCGIAGYIGKDKEKSADVFRRHLLHRGPDEQDVWSSDRVLLFHARLKIIDLSQAASQPMVSHCGRYVMVYNGEVYNFTAIKNEILKKDPSIIFRSHSDSEVILEAFAMWGTAMAEKLNGMFAIAIYDTREDRLFLFRDRLGEKPLYYYHSNGVFAFASELKALANLPDIRKEINNTALRYYLNLGFIPEPHTIWNSIHKFPKASFAIHYNKDLAFTRYWDPSVALTNGRKQANAATEEEFEALLEDAVAMRLISDVPLGLLLSGGTDSSLVTALAQKNNGVPLKTFSIGFEDRNKDESAWAERVAKHIGTEHHTLVCTEKQALGLVPEIVSCYDEPYADSSALPTMLVSGLARKHVTVALTGDGGDEQFLGYGAHRWAERLSNPALYALRYPAAFFMNMGGSRYKRIASMLKYQSSTSRYQHILSQEQYMFSEAEVCRLFAGRNTPMPALGADTRNLPLSPGEQQAFNDLLVYLPDDLLVKTDRASMKYSLELRPPLLDHRLVEFSLSLPRQFKEHKGCQKFLLKKILSKYIPHHLVYRKKQGFAVPLDQWLRNELMPMAEHYLSTREINRYGLLNTGEVNRMVSGFYNKGYHFYYVRIWQMLVLQLFMEANLSDKSLMPR